ncbi:MAG: NADH-quinone oxidoreductase subunit L [Alphaproteobacteria bacterium]
MELLAVFLPLLAFLIAGIFGKQIGDTGCQFVTCAALIVAAFVSILLFFDVALGGHAYTTVLAPWVVSGDFSVSWALRIDQLSVVMMCVINIVSACVHVYSVGYMSHDEAKGRFMAYLSLFTFAMLMLVTADNLLQLFFGWEGVGLASYLLIGFWNHKNSANAAAVKAFVVNRVGDFGLALGIFAIFVVFGSIQFDVIFERAPEMAGAYFTFFGQDLHALTVIGLLLFVGAVGKSAQLGLHTWLPDAMEGPTPVSALIHAATMVTAGVFLVARMSPLYEYAPDALMVVTVVGATTAFVAATIGLTQFDIKRVIAYSTMSQLGYMFFALGVSAYGAAMFHLMTHAFFKALLFLGAGSVIHAMSDEQDMRKMGGIWRKIPMTYGLMWIGSLALAGIPPFAGYFSKDIVLESAWADATWFGYYAYWMGIAAAFMTAFYSWRLLIMTFHGESRASKKVFEHVHESPSVMLGPLVILAAGALFAGLVFYQGFVGSAAHHGGEHVSESLVEHPEIAHGEHHGDTTAEEYFEEHPPAMSKEVFWGDAIHVRAQNDTVEAAHNVPFWVKKMPLVAGGLGIALAYLFYMLKPGLPGLMSSIFSVLHRLFFNKWFFDEIYDVVFTKTAFKLGRFFWIFGDQGTIDRFGPDGSAKAARRLAGGLSRFQSGFVYQYAFVMMIAVIAIISWFVFRSGA